MVEIADLQQQMAAQKQHFDELFEANNKLIAELLQSRQTPVKVIFHTGPANELIRAEIVQSPYVQSPPSYKEPWAE